MLLYNLQKAICSKFYCGQVVDINSVQKTQVRIIKHNAMTTSVFFIILVNCALVLTHVQGYGLAAVILGRDRDTYGWFPRSILPCMLGIKYKYSVTYI